MGLFDGFDSPLGNSPDSRHETTPSSQGRNPQPRKKPLTTGEMNSIREAFVRERVRRTGLTEAAALQEFSRAVARSESNAETIGLQARSNLGSEERGIANLDEVKEYIRDAEGGEAMVQQLEDAYESSKNDEDDRPGTTGVLRAKRKGKRRPNSPSVSKPGRGSSDGDVNASERLRKPRNPWSR